MVSTTPQASRLRVNLIEFYSFWEKALRMSPDEQAAASFKARYDHAIAAGAAFTHKLRGEAMRSQADRLERKAADAARAATALAATTVNYEKLDAFRPPPLGPIHPFAKALVSHSLAAAVYWVLCEARSSRTKTSELCTLLQERFDIAIDLRNGELQFAFDELGCDRLIEFDAISYDAFTETKTDWKVYLRSPHQDDRLVHQYGREARLLIRIMREQGLEPGVDNWRTINVAHDSQFFVRAGDPNGAIGLVKAISYGAAAGLLEFDDGRVRLTTATECEAICVENRAPAVRLSGRGATGFFRIASVERPFGHITTHPALDAPNELWPDDLGMPPVRLTRKMGMLLHSRNRGCGYRYNDQEHAAQLPDLLSHPNYDTVPPYQPIFLPPKTEPSAGTFPHARNLTLPTKKLRGLLQPLRWPLPGDDRRPGLSAPAAPRGQGDLRLRPLRGARRRSRGLRRAAGHRGERGAQAASHGGARSPRSALAGCARRAHAPAPAPRGLQRTDRSVRLA